VASEEAHLGLVVDEHQCPDREGDEQEKALYERKSPQ